MLKTMIERPIVVFLVAAMVSIAGIISAILLPIQILPKLEAPFVNVSVILEHETDLDQVERDIVIPLETAIINANGVNEVEVNASTRSVYMTVHLKDGAKEAEVDAIIEDLNRQLASINIDTRRKEAKQYTTEDNVFMAIAIVPKDINDISVREELKNTVLPELAMVSQVRGIDDTLDLYDPNYEFTLKQDRPISLNTSIQLFDELRSTFDSSLLGSLSYGGEQYRVKSQSSVYAIDELAQYRLSNGEMVTDRFTIEEKLNADNSYLMVDGHPYYEVNITIASTASEVKVAKEVRQKLEQLHADKSSDWSYYYIWDSSLFIGQAISELAKNILLGSLLASIILLTIFRSIKTMIVIGISIPICILTTFVFMNIFGFSINIISLLGLGIGVGLIVDACIVVLENIFRKLEAGVNRREAVYTGVKEVQGPVTSSIVTTIAVFVPIGFLEGMIGSMMKQMALTISISLVTSLLVAFTMIPIFSMYLVKPNSEKQQKHTLMEFYGKVLARVLRHRWKTMGVFTIVLGILLFQLVASVPKGYIPDVMERALFVRYFIDENTDFEVNKRLLDNTAEKIKEVEGVQSVIYWAHKGSRAGTFYIHYDDVEDMTRSEAAVDKDVEMIINNNIPYSSITIGAGQADASGQILLSIKGSSMGVISRELPAIEQQLQLFDGVTGIEVSRAQAGEEWIVDFSRENLAYYGLSRQEIERQLAVVLNGMTNIDINLQGENVKADILFPETTRAMSDALGNLQITDNRHITLNDIANVYKEPAENSRVRRDGLPYTSITVYFDSEDREKVYTQMQNYINDGYNGSLLLSTAGREQDQQEAFEKLLIAMAVSLATVFLVLTIQFNRLRQPFLIVASLPFTMIGVSLGFIITGRIFDAMAMIGVIMLVGIVVNNAIVLIDFINKHRDQYEQLNEAIVAGAKIRFRPILTTTLTTVAGLIPMFIGGTNTSEFQTPVATAVIFGLLCSVFVSLIILPVIYSIFENRSFMKHKQQQNQMQTTEVVVEQT
ncbi:efflux RND transporter permease subunit [Desulfuribacillus alkaliarsenatis]|uniref:Acriflavin resistance protein n=1 Tax=Desulfuribacillus alkaliarsenatis TaxID=766136 RepID=A0A1E5G436_9FIRM|nr:efflux RND transporter permease subunit [Desulfuribacillus alkaliarsenatis]OEF97429.1 hypothetical protein BHF68_04260 [Desulfuribacillus alkaliarsenatis]